MEIIRENYVNTTTQFVVNSNTTTVSNIMNPDIRFQYASDILNNDLTTATMRINFSETLTVDRIAIVGHNLKDFTVFYDGVTANTFALTATANTSTTDYVTNSATSHYFRVSPVACTSVSIDMKKTIVADQNKTIGYLVVSEKLTDFDGRVPSSENYRPTLNPQAVVHRLSDGGTRIQTLGDKWTAQLGFDYVTQTTRDELKTIFDAHNEMIFCPFGTTTGWDAVIFPCVWNGPFNFFQHSDNAVAAGFSGNLTLEETPT
jgi:hypothetical protein